MSGSMGFPATGTLVRVLLEGLPLAVCIHDEAGSIVDYNAQAASLWGGAPPRGYSAGRYAGFQQLFTREGAPMPQAASPVAHVIETGQAVIEAKIVGERPDGSFRTVIISVLPLSEHGSIAGAISCFRDVPADNPNPLDEPHEWEMLSRLCGSLGHDLANLFQSIRLNVNLVERRTGEQSPDNPSIEKPLRGMAQAADRGLGLTRQLLAYAGRQHLSCMPTDINRLLAGMAPSLGALAGPRVRLKLRPASQLWMAHADPEQVKQAVFNVVTNACEAMKGVGDITIATAFATLPAESGVRVAGDYVLISIADSGPGMDRDTLTSAFQPYFTTKKGAEAQGFGLSTTLGIMRQHRGDIQVDSRPDHGTRVTLSLPRSTAEPLPIRRVTEVEVGPMRGKTVLVVDDDAEVRGAAVDMLESYGFDVLFSASGHDALGLLGSARPIDLILADFRLGVMDGVELVRQARVINPGLKAILISGFGDVRNKITDEDRIVVLQKPLRADALLQNVRDALSLEGL